VDDRYVQKNQVHGNWQLKACWLIYIKRTTTTTTTTTTITTPLGGLKTHPITYYDFLDLFVQEYYYSYCDELLFWQSSWVHLNLVKHVFGEACFKGNLKEYFRQFSNFQHV
jgi:hypothetical protein